MKHQIAGRRGGLRMRCSDYMFVPGRKKNLLVYKGFTFSQYSTGVWYCSKRSKRSLGCKAAVYMNRDSQITHYHGVHMHLPPRFHITQAGEYSSVADNLAATQKSGRSASDILSLVKESSGVPLPLSPSDNPIPFRLDILFPANRMVKDWQRVSMGGDDYLFSDGSPTRLPLEYAIKNVWRWWRAVVDKNAGRWYCSKRAAGCKAAVYTNRHERIERYNDAHTHPPLPNYVLIPSSKKKNLLVHKGYSFSQQNESHRWYCSKKGEGCKARIHLGVDGSIKYVSGEHSHEPPRFHQRSHIQDSCSSQSQATIPDHVQPAASGQHLFCARTDYNYPIKFRTAEQNLYYRMENGYNRSGPRFAATVQRKRSAVRKDYVLIPTKKKHLLIYKGYSFSQQHVFRNWYCSKKAKGCKARIHMNNECEITSYDDNHTHEAPKFYVTTGDISDPVSTLVFVLSSVLNFDLGPWFDSDSSPFLDFVPRGAFNSDSANSPSSDLNDAGYYILIPSKKKKLLLYRGYTFSQLNDTKHWHCSSKQAKNCRARIRLGGKGEILLCDDRHTHAPPKFHVTKTDSNYLLVPAKKKYLLIYRGYSFSQWHASRYWYCSKKATGCKARIHLNDKDQVAFYDGMHTHEPPRFHVTSAGEYARMKTDEVYVTKHPSGIRSRAAVDAADRQSAHAYFIHSEGKTHVHYVLVPTKKKNLLIYKGYSFSQWQASRYWYCSRKNTGCKARIHLNDNDQIAFYDGMHTHDPPRFYVTKAGHYVKI
ncbi:hypothetical protein EVAR_42951_1 [Eumeta japonica]|uniref:FLYWCH-type domain-containing protein n=1 Tax=Eumeta variegata TaxID=151549 RepID=A0A4C1YGL7_EUMVA|nr:hypothetical protein EVAR_42951_1 [Eumeta japonica]